MEVRGVKAVLPMASQRRICRVLGVSRSGARLAYQSKPVASSIRHAELETRLRELIQLHPTFGYRCLWALLRFKNRYAVNVKTSTSPGPEKRLASP